MLTLQIFFHLWFLCLNVAIWCLTISQSYQPNSQFSGTLWPFITTDLTLGLIIPVLVIFSLLPIARIIRYVTYSRIETRKLLLWFSPFLGYEKGNKGVYWVIEDSFYYKIHNGHCGNLSTALIYVMTSLTFLFSWIYFIDKLFIKHTGLVSCMQMNYENLRQSWYCFQINPSNLNLYVNCSQNSSYTGRLFCFAFEEGGNTADIVQAFVISVILYYISVVCISLAFQVMKWLQQHASSYLWPTLLVVTGFVTFSLGMIFFAYNLYFNSHLNILTLFQILVLSANITVVGVLVAGGQLSSDQQNFSENNSIELTSFRAPWAINNTREPNSQPRVASNSQFTEEGLNRVVPHPSQPPVITMPTSQDDALATSVALPPSSPTESVSPPPPSSTPPPPISSTTTLTVQDTSSSANLPVQQEVDTTSEHVLCTTEEDMTLSQAEHNETSESQTTVPASESQNVSATQPSGNCTSQSLTSITLPHMQRPPAGIRRAPYIIPNYATLPRQSHMVNVPMRIQYTNMPPASVAMPIYISHHAIPSETELHTANRKITIV